MKLRCLVINMVQNIDKILLISPPRSGSQLVMTMLEDSSIYLLNEIFTFQNYVKQYVGNKNDVYKNPSKYIDYFLDKSDKTLALAKILITTWPEERLDKILNNGNYRFIFVYRENLLESMVSLDAARNTGLWMAEGSNNRIPDKLEMDINLSEKKCENFYSKIKYCLDNLNLKKDLVIKYEDIYNNNNLSLNIVNKIRKFVGLQLLNSFKSRYIKQNGKITYSRITNRKELEDRLGEKYGFLGSRVTPRIWK